MFPLAPTGGPGAGCFPSNIAFSCTNDTGSTVSAGDIVAFDIAAGTDSSTPGSGSRWEQAQQVTTAMLTNGAVFAVVVNGGRNGEKIRVSIAGVHTVSATAGITAGEALTGDNAAFTVEEAAAAGEKIIAYALGATDGNSQVEVVFNGWGFGVHWGT